VCVCVCVCVCVHVCVYVGYVCMCVCVWRHTYLEVGDVLFAENGVKAAAVIICDLLAHRDILCVCVCV